ncbi:hypothetical protein [Rhodosalinus sp. 5P4]|uniref:hypothetical protein n=1 Tax=Rhodosalinus sp. 5P4 TaxID=3239196 RepID=UPI0035258F59
MAKILELHRERRLPGGHLLEFAENGDGGVTLIIWQDEHRDDGLVFEVPDWQAALRAARDVERYCAEQYGGQP